MGLAMTGCIDGGGGGGVGCAVGGPPPVAGPPSSCCCCSFSCVNLRLLLSSMESFTLLLPVPISCGRPS